LAGFNSPPPLAGLIEGGGIMSCGVCGPKKKAKKKAKKRKK